MGFKKYVAVVTPEESKALIRDGADYFGSIRKLADRLTFSYSHVYRWSNAESAMALKDYLFIKDLIAKYRKRKEKRVC